MRIEIYSVLDFAPSETYFILKHIRSHTPRLLPNNSKTHNYRLSRLPAKRVSTQPTVNHNVPHSEGLGRGIWEGHNPSANHSTPLRGGEVERGWKGNLSANHSTPHGGGMGWERLGYQLTRGRQKGRVRGRCRGVKMRVSSLPHSSCHCVSHIRREGSGRPWRPPAGRIVTPWALLRIIQEYVTAVEDTPVSTSTIFRRLTDDELLFCLDTHIHRNRVWRHPGQYWDPRFIVEWHTAPTRADVVCGAISYDSRTPLVASEGTVTTSSDLSPIDNIGCQNGRQLQPAATTEDLESQLLQLWQNLPENIRHIPVACQYGETCRSDVGYIFSSLFSVYSNEAVPVRPGLAFHCLAPPFSSTTLYYTTSNPVKACSRSAIAADIRASMAPGTAFPDLHGQISYQSSSLSHLLDLRLTRLFTPPITKTSAACLILQWSGAGIHGRENREITDETRRPASSSGTIPICENPGGGVSTPGSPGGGEQSNHHTTAAPANNVGTAVMQEEVDSITVDYTHAGSLLRGRFSSTLPFYVLWFGRLCGSPGRRYSHVANRNGDPFGAGAPSRPGVSRRYSPRANGGGGGVSCERRACAERRWGFRHRPSRQSSQMNHDVCRERVSCVRQSASGLSPRDDGGYLRSCAQCVAGVGAVRARGERPGLHPQPASRPRTPCLARTGERELPEKTRRPAASSGKVPTQGLFIVLPLLLSSTNNSVCTNIENLAVKSLFPFHFVCSHVRQYGSNPAANRTRFALLRGEGERSSCRLATTVPSGFVLIPPVSIAGESGKEKSPQLMLDSHKHFREAPVKSAISVTVVASRRIPLRSDHQWPLASSAVSEQQLTLLNLLASEIQHYKMIFTPSISEVLEGAPWWCGTGRLASRGQGDVRGRGRQSEISWAVAALRRPHMQTDRPVQRT
ncbi:hypothetical protein PR048_016150 [Dryococelus australis]|uniref:Uncharacterized protein n=1 Tax=Dryococelus australis TaxID=614101 RepID=A0ABQ9HIY2_9NEOP|nr:hypothetical protein PR048_016150 [Dryococelus australis]